MSYSSAVSKSSSRRILGLNGPLTVDPKTSIERTVSIFKRKVQVQTLIISGTSLAVAIALLLSKEETHEAEGSV